MTRGHDDITCSIATVITLSGITSIWQYLRANNSNPDKYVARYQSYLWDQNTCGMVAFSIHKIMLQTLSTNLILIADTPCM